MKTASVVLFFLAGVLFAQDADRLQQPDNKEVKKLGSVTWNLESHKLEWVIQKGSNINGKFVPKSEDHYAISPDDAVMSFANQNRGFTQEEAENLQHLLDVLSLYCAESVVWWDQGQGVPLDPGSNPVPHKKNDKKTVKPGDKPTKVDHHRQEQAPQPYRVNDADYVASVQPAR
jgi:hypothetical protein